MSRRKRKQTQEPRNPGYKDIRLKARTEGQREFIDKVKSNSVTLCSGPPGSGKTHIAVALAVRGLKNGEYNKVMLTRPAVEASSTLGFLPGGLNEKLGPYLTPLFDELSYYLEKRLISQLMGDGVIEICPVGFFRGRTLKNTFLVADECQNATISELRMVLSRLGEGSKMVVAGDVKQSDITNSGFKQLMTLMEGIEDLEVHRFTYGDVVRHPLVVTMEQRFNKEEENE